MVASVSLVILAACGDPDPSPPTAADLREIDMSPDLTVVVDESGYDPAIVDVTAGEVLRLVNDGESEHSFTADTRQFDTGRMRPGEDVTLVLTEVGKVSFHDLEEPDHRGTFTVRSPG